MAERGFIGLKYREAWPAELSNVFVVQADDWNDFGAYVRFDLHYVDASGARTRFGKIKILHRSQSETSSSVDRRTTLPRRFSELGREYISIGQNEDYYEQLGLTFGSAEAVEILVTLRDIAEMPGIAADFETSPPFRNGLMRENSARRARRFGRAWVRGEDVSLTPSFSYAAEIAGTAVPILAKFDFAPADRLPGRIVTIVGRNAVGKTVFLSQLGADLAQVDQISEVRLGKMLERFPEDRPTFSRVIAISYSAFDRFRRPKVTPYSSYVYCGIRNDKGGISHASLRQSYSQNLRRIVEHEREQDWTRHVLAILGAAEGLSHKRLTAEIHQFGAGGLLDELSSGQAILCHFVTALLAWIEQESIVLFDEPETHLHPNAVGNLFLVLSEVLDRFDSYAILATHSPIVLQEVPARRVLNFVREGDVTTAERLGLESFGESITELTRHVFNTIEVDSHYKHVLTGLARRYPAEEVLRFFPSGLSMSAQAFLLGQYGDAGEAGEGPREG